MAKKTKTILVANNHLSQPGGSETYTYAVIKELLSRGYDVEYFTFEKGDFSLRMENEIGVKFKNKKKYDLILANHNTCVEALVGLGYIIQTCHGIYPELEQPSFNANFHVAISQEVQNHLATKGLPSIIIMNGIDTSKFYSKKNINKELKNVLSLCQSEHANIFLQGVCDHLNINLTCINKLINPLWNIADAINEADLVIGLGRSAFEAMACGRPVIVYDNRPYSESFADGYVVNKLSSSLINNCSGRFYKLKLTEEMMINEFKKYNPADGEILKNHILDSMTIQFAIDKYLNLFDHFDLENKLLQYQQKYFPKYSQKIFHSSILNFLF